jgi:hypothetical protein
MSPKSRQQPPARTREPEGPSTSRLDGTERARDEQRDDDRPRYGGGAWEVADERGAQRFGHARNDDADPSELSRGTHAVDDDEWPGADASLPTGATGEAQDIVERTDAADDGATERGQERAGFGRGEQPRKPKARTRKNPKPHTKKKG